MSDAGDIVWTGGATSGGSAEAAGAARPAALERAGFAVEVRSADGLSDALADRRPDCVVCDADGCPDPIAAVEAVRDAGGAAVVVLDRSGDASLAHDSVAAGATEYVPTTDEDALVDAVERAVERGRRARTAWRSQVQLRALFEEAPDPVAEYEFVDGEPVVRSVNRAFVEIFGYDREAAVGETLNDLIVPRDKESEARSLDERVRDCGDVDAEIERETTGGTREFLFRNVTLETEGGPDGYARYIDITDQRARERRLQEHNDRLNEFASVIGHDLRNPMGAVRHRIEMARQTGEDRHLEDALAALDRMDELLRDLLQMARQGERLSETEPLSLAEVAETAWEHIATGEATLVVRDDPTLVADRGRLTQLLENLFINAVEHGTDDDRADVELAVGVGDDGCVYVEDDGRGIPAEQRQNVFDSGYSTASDGTGYGLSIVRQVARAHDWKVGVAESAAGGARFEFRGVEFGDP